MPLMATGSCGWKMAGSSKLKFSSAVLTQFHVPSARAISIQSRLGEPSMDSLLRDLKFSARSLLKRPGLTIVAVITLAIGIGANSAIFSTINALLLKPLPFPDPERIVALWEKVPSRGVERNELAVANYLDWNAQNKSFEHLGMYRWWSTNLTGSESPERVQGFLVTPNFLDIVGVKPMLGRGFSNEHKQ